MEDVEDPHQDLEVVGRIPTGRDDPPDGIGKLYRSSVSDSSMRARIATRDFQLLIWRSLFAASCLDSNTSRWTTFQGPRFRVEVVWPD